MPYIVATRNQRRFAESLARDIGWRYAALDTFCDMRCGKPLAKLSKQEASLVIDELLRERDAVTLAGFRERGQVSTEG